ncbi:DUF5987 family protein [Allorhizocola rhizosphaerae]|uniref:DUF5987 family protein n=1 Tax=Allorhizocola rhizosphaerae TaxID=1872709 RepID=UPI000E3D6B02|nr:DUF5987 family protein [Allorhizocola rhizosphaerae]
MPPPSPDLDAAQVMSLEAYADTILPGAKRAPHDHAIAGACATPGAVAAGALDLLRWEATGFAGVLDTLADGINHHALAYAQDRELELGEALPPFVALSFSDRTALVQALTTPGHPEHEMWVGLALFCYMAYDSAAHLSTAEALAAGHPGLTAMGFAGPEPDGLWRFPRYSYQRELARPHPFTSSTGSPA